MGANEERHAGPKGLESDKPDVSLADTISQTGPRWSVVRIPSELLARVERVARHRAIAKSQLVAELVKKGLEEDE
jgi:hypothetical protein